MGGVEGHGVDGEDEVALSVAFEGVSLGLDGRGEVEVLDRHAAFNGGEDVA